MRETLCRVIQLASAQSGIPVSMLSAESAIDQDIRISGDDVTCFAGELAKEFGNQVWQWPWQRYADLSEPHLLTGLWFIWRLLTWPIRGRVFDSSPFERLELGHIAAVIERGEWFDP